MYIIQSEKRTDLTSYACCLLSLEKWQQHVEQHWVLLIGLDDVSCTLHNLSQGPQSHLNHKPVVSY